jgi:hypothetical protein
VNDPVGLSGEIGWKKVTSDNLDRYKTFAFGTMHYINRGEVCYGCARFDRSDKKLFPRSNRREARDKLVYQLLLHGFALRAARLDRMFIYPDRDMIRGSTFKLTEMLNGGIAQERKWLGVDIVRSIKPMVSHHCHFVQMADLITGAIACLNNKCHDPSKGRGKAKQELAEYVESLAGVSLTKPTPGRRTNFDIWFFQPRIKKASVSPTTSAEPRVQTGHATP